MRNSERTTIHRLLVNSRFEVLPTASVADKIIEHVPRDVAVTVTASPGKGLDATLGLAETLGSQGFRAVPHLAARMVSGRSELEEIVARLKAADIDSVFVPGGDASAGDGYADALELLKDLTDMGSPFSHVGVAGYPESHPTIHDDVTVQSMWDKRGHATHVVSNLTFDPQLIASWVHRMRLRGIGMPLLVGIPGPVDRAKLLSMATKIGVGESTRFLVKQKGVMARLMAPGGFTGETFLRGFAPAAADPEALVEGLHVYTFNQIAETAAWRAELLERLAAS